MHLTFCSNEKCVIKYLLFKSVFCFSFQKSNKLQKVFNFLFSLPHKPNLSDLVLTLFFSKSRLTCFLFALEEKGEMCCNTFALSNQAFLNEIIFFLDPLETFIVRLSEIIYSDKKVFRYMLCNH